MDSIHPTVNDQPESSVHLEIGSAGKRVSTLDPQVEAIEIRDPSSLNGSAYHKRSELHPTWQISGGKATPEKKITLFALRLALLEKAASGLGTLGFIWATVVLLGGFAIKLEKADFWFVTVILLIESTRIFSRSHELEWQHESTLSVTDMKNDAKRASFRIYHASRSFLSGILAPFGAAKVTDRGTGTRCAWGCRTVKRSWSRSDVQLVPYTGWLSVSQKVGRLLFWLQLLSASTCVALSVWRLVGQDYGVLSGSENKNRRSALNVFYGMSAAEALLFLLEKSYWQWKIAGQKLLVKVNEEFGFDSRQLGTVRRFFYDAYSRCVNGSIFDGLNMDFVSYSVELLKSNSNHGQLTGARVLAAFVNDGRFAEETLRSIGVMQDVVERLVEMLNWKNRHEQHIRKAAAEIVCNLVKKNRNSLRVAWIPGALESVASLLYDAKQNEVERYYDYSGFSLIGLRILKNLAKDHTNFGKIGSTKDLLPKIVGFTEVDANFSNARIRTVKLSLQLLKMVASSNGVTGKELRKEILKNVFTVSNLKDVLLLYRGSDHLRLQILAIESLTNLALDEEGRESIASTGGVLATLFSVYFMGRINSDEEMKQLVCKAGEALTLLTLNNTHNCQSMIKLKLAHDRSKQGHVIRDLIAVLKDPVHGVHSARILRNLCAYADTACDELREITAAAAQVLKLVMEEQGTFEEAAIGLAAQMIKLMDKSEMDRVFKEAEIRKELLMGRLIQVLGRHRRPSIRVPNVRRFCIELVIYMLEKEKENENGNGCFGLEMELEFAVERVRETTSEMESYSTLSGSIGLAKHHVTIQSLVHTAMELLRMDESNR